MPPVPNASACQTCPARAPPSDGQDRAGSGVLPCPGVLGRPDRRRPASSSKATCWAIQCHLGCSVAWENITIVRWMTTGCFHHTSHRCPHRLGWSQTPSSRMHEAAHAPNIMDSNVPVLYTEHAVYPVCFHRFPARWPRRYLVAGFVHLLAAVAFGRYSGGGPTFLGYLDMILLYAPYCQVCMTVHAPRFHVFQIFFLTHT